jgi:osmotically-inducible protein OsmY
MIATSQPTEQCRDTGHDLQLCRDVITALRGSGYTALHCLSCSVLDGHVEISGAVPSFYMKQMAQVAVMQLEGADGVQNLIEVRDQPPESPSTQ